METTPPSAPSAGLLQTAAGYPRDHLDNRFVYVVISPRARGLSVGVNMNPDKTCNFDCVYCEVQRNIPPRDTELDVAVMTRELKETLELVHSGQLQQRSPYHRLPPQLLQLRHVTLSGDGEPTQSTQFVEAIEGVVHVRATGGIPPFKLVLITNATGLDLPQVRRGIKRLSNADEIWVKLDAGTQAYMTKVNQPREHNLEDITGQILRLSKERPVVIQSLFLSIDGVGPTPEELDKYAERLSFLQREGAQISSVQIYSATRPTPHSECGHLPLSALSKIAERVRNQTNLQVQVF